MNQFKILPPEKRPVLRLLSSTEKTEHAKSRACSRKKQPLGGEKMIEKGLILTGSDAELLSRALSEVKTKVYEESETSLDNTEALSALVSCFRTAEKEEQDTERRHSYFSPLHKRLVLGTVIERLGGADSARPDRGQ
jgi:hypothetical protein